MIARMIPVGGTVSGQAPVRVLVVDDDAAARDSLATSLSLDFEVGSCEDGRRAEAALAGGDYDVLVVDYEMPGMAGTELLQRVRDSHPTIVGILVTGHADLPDVKRARASADVFLVVMKPCDPRELLRWVTMAGRTARLRKANLALRGLRSS